MPKGGVLDPGRRRGHRPQPRSGSTLRSGAGSTYDKLVVAPGIQLDWDEIPGMSEALDTPMVSSNYTYELAPETWSCIRAMRIGHGDVHHAVRADQVRRRPAEDRLPGRGPLAPSKVC